MLPAVVVCLAAALNGEAQAPVDVASRAKGAGKIVVATVKSVESRFEVNPFGDQLILSDMTLQVHETLRGAAIPSLVVTIEGGTVGDLKLEVSDIPILRPGDRAVFLLNERGPDSDSYLPHQRGLGILKLDAANRIEDSNLTLDDVRRALPATAR